MNNINAIASIRKQKSIILFVIAIVILAVGFTVAVFTTLLANESQNFVRGEFGKYCYEEHNYPRQIRHFLYFKTYKDCMNSLKK